MLHYNLLAPGSISGFPGLRSGPWHDETAPGNRRHCLVVDWRRGQGTLRLFAECNRQSDPDPGNSRDSTLLTHMATMTLFLVFAYVIDRFAHSVVAFSNAVEICHYFLSVPR